MAGQALNGRVTLESSSFRIIGHQTRTARWEVALQKQPRRKLTQGFGTCLIACLGSSNEAHILRSYLMRYAYPNSK